MYRPFALLLLIINMEKLTENVLVTPKIQLRKTNLHQSQDNAKRTLNPSRPDFSQRYALNKQFSHQIRKADKLQRLNAPLFFDNNQSSRLANSKGIKKAENQLQDRYKIDLSGYLRKKFQQLVFRRQEIDTHERLLTSALSHSSSSQKSITMKQLITLSKYSPHKEKVINQAYLLNAKERIDRMIGLKYKREEYYNDIRDNLKRKLMEKESHRQRTMMDQHQRDGIAMRGRMNDQEWDRKWLNDYINQKSRYRKRLINKKFNKKFQDTP